MDWNGRSGTTGICTPGCGKPEDHATLEMTDDYRPGSPLTATRANRMRNGKGSTAKSPGRPARRANTRRTGRPAHATADPLHHFFV